MTTMEALFLILCLTALWVLYRRRNCYCLTVFDLEVEVGDEVLLDGASFFVTSRKSMTEIEVSKRRPFFRRLWTEAVRRATR